MASLLKAKTYFRTEIQVCLPNQVLVVSCAQNASTLSVQVPRRPWGLHCSSQYVACEILILGNLGLCNVTWHADVAFWLTLW